MDTFADSDSMCSLKENRTVLIAMVEIAILGSVGGGVPQAFIV